MSCLAQAPHAPIAASCDVMHDVAERHGGLCHVAEQCHSDLHVALTRPDTHSGVAWSTQYLHAGVPQILLASPGSTLCQAFQSSPGVVNALPFSPCLIYLGHYSQ